MKVLECNTYTVYPELVEGSFYRSMKKYLQIYSILLKNAFSRDAHYRADTITHWITHIIWLGMLYILVDVLFRYTNVIAGWTRPEVFFLMNILILSQQIFLFFFRDNIYQIPNIITDGKLDSYFGYASLYY